MFSKWDFQRGRFFQSLVAVGVVVAGSILVTGTALAESIDFNNSKEIEESKVLFNTINKAHFFDYFRGVPDEEMAEILASADQSPKRAMDVTIVSLMAAMQEGSFNTEYARDTFIKILDKATEDPGAVDFDRIERLGKLVWLAPLQLETDSDQVLVKAITKVYIDAFLVRNAQALEQNGDLARAMDFYLFLRKAEPSSRVNNRSSGILELIWLSGKIHGRNGISRESQRSRPAFAETKKAVLNRLIELVPAERAYMLDDLYERREIELDVVRILSRMAEFDREKTLARALRAVEKHISYRDPFSGVLPEVTFLFAYGSADDVAAIKAKVIDLMSVAYRTDSGVDEGSIAYSTVSETQKIFEALGRVEEFGETYTENSLDFLWVEIKEYTYPFCAETAAISSSLYRKGYLRPEQASTAIADLVADECLSDWNAVAVASELIDLCNYADTQQNAEVVESCVINLIPEVNAKALELKGDGATFEQGVGLDAALKSLIPNVVR